MEMLSMLKVGYTVLRSETPATDLVNTFMDWAALALFMPPYYAYKLASSAAATASPEDIAGKVVLVTGASSGIGEQIAYQYAKKGARLALVARREGNLRDVAARARDLGSPDLLVLPGDVARPEDCKAFVQATVERFGTLDHLVNNAGLANVCWFQDVPDVADFKQVLDVNLWGTVHPTHCALPHLKRSRGKIFVNSSAAALLAMPRMSFYNASKAAVMNFAETLRMELGDEVGVTVATPGWIESEMTEGKHLSKEGTVEVDQDTRDAQVGVFPVVRAERCAEAIVDAVCRGRRSVTVPAWYRALFLWRAFAPEVGDVFQRVFYRRSSGDEGSQMRARRVLELTGAKALLQPPSLHTSEIKRDYSAAPLAALLVLFLPAYYVYKLTTSFLGTLFPEDVAGKVVLITGASSGIGEHLAYEYAKRGANLALVARREASLRKVADNALALGSPVVLVLPADVSKPDECRKFIDDTVTYFGRLDHLVNNASIWQVCKFEEVEDVNYFKELMDINFWGHVYPTRHAIPHLKRTHGRIVGVTSNSSYIFIGRNTFYNASKAAALNFYDTLRMELVGEIRITEVVPGVIESEITKGKMLTKEGEMKVNQDERDAILGPTPAESVGNFAKTVVRDVCRGTRYVFEPRWYMAVYLFRVCFPEILAWNSRLLTVKTLGPATTDTLGKQILDLPGVRWFTQPGSLRSPEIRAR